MSHPHLKARWEIFAALLLMTGVFTPSTLSAQPANSIIGATILTESLPRGYWITAVVIEYDKADRLAWHHRSDNWS